jgi:D-alanine-D-alanine ligase
MKLPKVMVLHNEPTLPAEHPDADAEHDIIETADHIAKIFALAGLPVAPFGFIDKPEDLLAGLRVHEPDVVFNLYEGTATWGNSEAFVAAILEMMRIPFTGSPTQPLILARSKVLTKQLLAGAQLPTARFQSMSGDESIPVNRLGWPVIVKPGREDASIGIDQNSVVTSQHELERRVQYLRGSYGPEVLFEQFIVGREFHVAVWERDGRVQALPFSEIFFHQTDGPDALWPIVSFDAKWKENSRDYKATPVKNPADVTAALFEKVSAIAVQAFELLGCRDYARIDFRVTDDEPFILEVNPNPCISPLAGVAEALASAGFAFSEFVLSLIRSALRRGPAPALAEFPAPMQPIVVPETDSPKSDA